MKYLLPLVLLILTGCGPSTDNYDPAHKNGLITYYHKDGSISQQTTYKDNVKDGPEKIYFRKGNLVRKEIMLVKGVVEGDVKEFYDDGKINEITPYKAGLKEGLQKSYYRSGQLKAQVSYRKGYPGTDLLEYNEQGGPVKENPTILFEPVDRRAVKSEYTLVLSLSGPLRKVVFYEGPLASGKFLNDSLFQLTHQSMGKAEYLSYVEKSGSLRKKLNFIALVTTSRNNPLVITKSYELRTGN